MTSPRLLGVVLAGGASRRFGGVKAEARLGEFTLAERALRTLQPFCGELRRSASDDLPDLRPGEGPLAGIEAALTHARATGAPGVVVLACDLPAIHTATLLRLVERWRASDDPARTIVAPDLPLQPLAAVWGVATLGAVRDALDRGARSVRDGVRDFGAFIGVDAERLAEEVGLAASQLLHNVNHSVDLPAARELVLPPIVSVVGWKDSGKTTIATHLLAALVERGVDVVAAKHGHHFRLDTEGTDSWRFRHEGGARRVLLAGPAEMALLGGWGEGGEPSLGGIVRRWLRDAELVVAEGWKAGPWPAIEVRRRGSTAPPLHDPGRGDSDRFLAVVDGGDDPVVVARHLADLVESRVLSPARRERPLS